VRLTFSGSASVCITLEAILPLSEKNAKHILT
jgi:hypothetical protein